MAMPKIFSLLKTRDYVEFFPKITILNRPFNLFLDCYSYDVILPVKNKKQSIINIFEETTLKLLHYKTCSIQEIAETLCLDKDLVSFIIIRLKELNLLDDKRNVTEIGKQLLNYSLEDETESSQILAKVFMNKETHEILPYIHIGDFKYENIEDMRGYTIKVGSGNAGNNRTYSGRYLSKKMPKVPPVLLRKDIIKVLKTYNRICITNPRFEKVDVDYERGIDVSPSEDVAIHLQAVIQDGNVDHIVISDGFIANIDFLAKYIKAQYPDIIHQIKEQATKQTINTDDKEPEQEILKYNNKYSEIVRLLKRNEVRLENTDQMREASEISKKTIIDCFAAIEWSLHYHFLADPLDDQMLSIFLNQSKNENRDMVIGCLKKIGVRSIQQNKKLVSNIDKAKVNDYLKYREPVLYTLLPLCIFEAAHNQQSNVHHLIRKMPDFLSFLTEINQKSMLLRHSVQTEDNLEYSEHIYKKTVEFISVLLIDFNQQYTVDAIKWNASQQRINAQNSLSMEMGSILFSSLDVGIQDELLKISGDKNIDQLPLPYEYILILSRVLETYFYQVIKECKRDIKLEKLSAIEQIEANRGRALPKSFTSINNNFYQNALDGKKATLGAYSVVLLRFADEELVKRLLELKFVDTIDKVLNLRKHGNRVGLCIDTQELNQLRLQVIDIIKTIGGYYG